MATRAGIRSFPSAAAHVSVVFLVVIAVSILVWTMDKVDKITVINTNIMDTLFDPPPVLAAAFGGFTLKFLSLENTFIQF